MLKANPTGPARPPYLSLFLMSAATLALEILLMRLLSMIQWHHFAYMIISLALLAYGVSGTVVAIWQRRLLARFQGAYTGLLFMFGLSGLGAFLWVQSVPFNAEEMLWHAGQIGNLLMMFLVLAVPFFFAASGICLVFRRYPDKIAFCYSFDLAGAGVGSLGIIVLLFAMTPPVALGVVGAFAVMAAAVAAWEVQWDGRRWFSLAAAGVAAAMVWVAAGVELKLSPYKAQEQMLQISGNRIIAESSSPLGWLTVMESTGVPLRHAPGLSINAPLEPPPQLGVFTDGDNMTALNQAPRKHADLTYLDYMTSALPYHLNSIKNVAVLGAGGGAEVWQARYHKTDAVDAVELNPQIVNWVNGPFGEFTGRLYQSDGVTVHIDEARGFLTRSGKSYDLIQLALVDSFNASVSGLYALNESYLYTTEALALYIQRLNSSGYLALTRWIKNPPRDTLKLFATAVDALKRLGIHDPANHLVLVRSWQTSTLLVKKTPFTPDEMARVIDFCAQRFFDVSYMPDMEPGLANQFNIMKEPVFHTAALAILGSERDAFFQNYKFRLQPATDDRPYFHHFLKWATLAELWALRGQGGMPHIEWGYIVIVATLIVAFAISVVLILLPIGFLKTQAPSRPDTLPQYKVVLYFFAIGLAFLFVEMAFIQKLNLLLFHPIYSIAATLSGFLIFSGIGSHRSRYFARQFGYRKALFFSIGGIALLAVIYSMLLGVLFGYLRGMPLPVNMAIALLVIAPLAFLMGMPFPLAMAQLSEHGERFIPWAWGVNGCASVISAVMAVLVAIHLGFSAVIMTAIVLYIIAGVSYPERRAAIPRPAAG